MTCFWGLPNPLARTPLGQGLGSQGGSHAQSPPHPQLTCAGGGATGQPHGQGQIRQRTIQPCPTLGAQTPTKVHPLTQVPAPGDRQHHHASTADITWTQRTAVSWPHWVPLPNPARRGFKPISRKDSPLSGQKDQLLTRQKIPHLTRKKSLKNIIQTCLSPERKKKKVDID